MSAKKAPSSTASSAPPKVCEICGTFHPYHRLDCPKVSGRYCPECEMRWPRHYPWCTQDEFNIGRWWVGLSGQGMLKEMYDVEREAALMAEGRHAKALQTPEEPHYYSGPDRPIRPADGNRLMVAIREMMSIPGRDVKAKDHHRKAIHDEIERLAFAQEKKE